MGFPPWPSPIQTDNHTTMQVWRLKKMTVWVLALLNKNGRISANNGPILKIRNLAYPGLRPWSVWRQWHHAQRHAPEWRHAQRHPSNYLSPQSWLQGSCWGGSYLQNCWVDFVHFLHANWYGVTGFAMKNSTPSGQYLGHERISLFPCQPIGIF